MRIGVYAASMDPITNGHLWVIEQGLKMFDLLHVVLAVNPRKTYAYPAGVRLQFLMDAVEKHQDRSTEPKLVFASIGNEYLADYARRVGASFLLRGIRNATDFDMEDQLQEANLRYAPELQTVCVICPATLKLVSSSHVKGLMPYKGWAEAIRPFVPTKVADEMMKRYVNDYWMKLCRRAGINDDAAGIQWQRIEEAYSERHRRYHNLRHVLACLEELEFIHFESYVGSDQQTKDVVAMAAFFHDLVYRVPGQERKKEALVQTSGAFTTHSMPKTDVKLPFRAPYGSSEADSAEEAHKFLYMCGAGSLFCDRVLACINATFHEAPPNEYNLEQYGMVDIDLSILGQNEATYRAYCAAIEKEYEAVPYEIYRPKRVEFLQKMLKREHLFGLREIRERYEEVARTNMQREIKELRGKP